MPECATRDRDRCCRSRGRKWLAPSSCAPEEADVELTRTASRTPNQRAHLAPVRVWMRIRELLLIEMTPDSSRYWRGLLRGPAKLRQARARLSGIDQVEQAPPVPSLPNDVVRNAQQVLDAYRRLTGPNWTPRVHKLLEQLVTDGGERHPLRGCPSRIRSPHVEVVGKSDGNSRRPPTRSASTATPCPARSKS